MTTYMQLQFGRALIRLQYHMKCVVLGVFLGLASPSGAVFLVEDIPHMLMNFIHWLENTIVWLDNLLTSIEHYQNAVRNASALADVARLKNRVQDVFSKAEQTYYRVNYQGRQILSMASGEDIYWENWYPPKTTDQEVADAQKRVWVEAGNSSQVWEDFKKIWTSDEREYKRNTGIIEFLKHADEKQEMQKDTIDRVGTQWATFGDDSTLKQLQALNAVTAADAKNNYQNTEALLQLLSNQNNDQRRLMELKRIRGDVEDHAFDKVRLARVTNPWR